MKTTLAIAVALGLGMASAVWAFDQDALNSKQALVTHSTMELKEKNIEKVTVASKSEMKEESIEKTTVASESKAAPEKKATVAVTRDASIDLGDRDTSKVDASRQNSKATLTQH